MDSKSVAETRTEGEIAAFMAGVEAELIEIRGRGMTISERAEYRAEAVAIYGETEAAEAA